MTPESRGHTLCWSCGVPGRSGGQFPFVAGGDPRHRYGCARDLLAALPKRPTLVEHRAALPHREVAAAVATVRDADAWVGTRLAFEFLVLTASRSGEVRLATWDEMDTINTKAYVWTIPATRMKAKREHRVPLCRRAVEVLDEARTLGDGSSPLVFPMRSGKAISATTLQHHRIAAVAHGFRSSFRDWAVEETDHPREVIEAALAHIVQNKVEAAYARSDLFERRRRLMDDGRRTCTETINPNGIHRSSTNRTRRPISIDYAELRIVN